MFYVEKQSSFFLGPKVKLYARHDKRSQLRHFFCLWNKGLIAQRMMIITSVYIKKPNRKYNFVTSDNFTFVLMQRILKIKRG